MRNLFKRIIVPTVFIISIFFCLGELKLPLGLALTTALVGAGVIISGILTKYKNILFKKKNLIKDEKKHTLLKTADARKFKNQRIAFQAKHFLSKSQPTSAPKLKLK